MEECDEELASEVELGSGTLRALWRWACYQASTSQITHYHSLQSTCALCVCRRCPANTNRRHAQGLHVHELHVETLLRDL